jgi:hypothetical protein
MQAVPYLHCPSCRLTIYKPRDVVRVSERCPRCGASLRRRPARLFQAATAGMANPPDRNREERLT